MHLIAMLHDSGTLQQYCDTPSLTDLDLDLARREANAKLEVLNYAASFGLIPAFSAQHISDKGLARVQVSITLPEQGIKVAATGMSLVHAEIRACIKFRAEAANRQLRTTGGEQNNATSVNLGNAGKILTFYESLYEGSKIDVGPIDKLQAPGGGYQYSAYITLNGQRLGPPGTMSTASKAASTAKLFAALTLVARQPSILQQYDEYIQNGRGFLLNPLQPMQLSTDDDFVAFAREITKNAPKSGAAAQARRNAVSQRPQGAHSGHLDASLRARSDYHAYEQSRHARSDYLKAVQELRRRDPRLSSILHERSILPVNQQSRRILDLVKRNT
ncbi:hypothetical protein LTS18_000707, partial [Coniosporium uncinatum]